jgi:hypothetical protein
MLQAKIDPIARDIEVLVARDLSPQAQSAALAAFAREQKAEIAAVNDAAMGKKVPVQTTVDGVADASEDMVRPAGTIVYEFELASDMLEWIGEQLVTHSPVKSGRYARSHILLADGVEFDPLSGDIPPAREYVFSNVQPYARKIEGDNNREPESSQAPDGVFEAVAALAQRRFGNIAKIAFGWRSLRGAAALDAWAGSESAARLIAKRRGSKANKADWLARQPSIIVTMR